MTFWMQSNVQQVLQADSKLQVPSWEQYLTASENLVPTSQIV